MDEEIVKEYIRRFNKKYRLIQPFSVDDIDCIELTPAGIDLFSKKCFENVSIALSKLSSNTPGAFLFFENCLMVAQKKGKKLEYLTKQMGMRDVSQLPISVDSLLGNVSSTNESANVGNFISWTVKPSEKTKLSEKIFKRFLSKGIRFYYERISDDETECIVYMPPFSPKILFPNWKKMVEEIAPEIPFDLYLKDIGSLTEHPIGKTHYLILHSPAIQPEDGRDDTTLEYYIVSAYRTEMNGTSHCLGCIAFDVDACDEIYEMQVFPDTVIRMKEIKASPKKEVTPETHSATKLPQIASHFQLDDSLYSFLDSITDSFIRKTYRLGDFSGGSDEFLQKMRQIYEENRELEIADLCVEMTDANDLCQISLGDAAYLAKKTYIETKQQVFVETGLSMHNSKNAYFGGCSIIQDDFSGAFELPANFAEATWKVKRSIYPAEYGTIKKKNLKKFTLDQVIEAIVAHNDNCTAADVAIDLLYFYGTDSDMEPSALFTAKVFMYLAKMPTIQFKASGGQAYGGIVYVENLGCEIAPVPVKKAKTQGKAVSSGTRREANFDSFGWYKPERAAKQSAKTSSCSSRKMIRPEGKMIRIDDADLSIRTYNSLKRAGIKYLNDLTDKSEKELFKIRNLGKKGVDEVRDRLESYGLSVKRD